MKKSEQTKRELAAAFKDLLTQVSFQKINVSDIAAHTGLSRKSFYYHFRDKYDLVSGIFDREFVQRNKELENGQWLEALCVYLYDQRVFYRNVMEYEGQNSFEEYMGACIREQLSEKTPMTDEDHFCAVLLSDAVLAMVKRWLTQDEMVSAEAFAGMLRRVAMEANRLWN